ncbi:type II toxin-antitoxin system HicA family toxin [Blautia wexlerae]|nr:type II toxin-antitoxin system HicA family toxin [Blautia wexlerae]MDB6490031.1 type II toxin-antitoxin system HicA family toxin [Blautia wexlerae]
MLTLLKENGFETVSQNGSHVKLNNQETGRRRIYT